MKSDGPPYDPGRSLMSGGFQCNAHFSHQDGVIRRRLPSSSVGPVISLKPEPMQYRLEGSLAIFHIIEACNRIDILRFNLTVLQTKIHYTLHGKGIVHPF